MTSEYKLSTKIIIMVECIYDTLAVFRDNIELEYIYSIKEEGDGVAAVDEVPYSDKWGEFYSAYSPVFDSSGKVQKNYSIQNWAEYSIHVHSLKSTSKMIGATSLFKQAGKLETASDKNETATILSEHDSMMKKYETVLEAIRKVIPDASTNSITENKDADTFEFSPEDDGIMEFLPEE